MSEKPVLEQFPFPPDADFTEWVASLPAKYWAKYDLSACRLGWEARKAFALSDAKSKRATEPLDVIRQMATDTEFTVATLIAALPEVPRKQVYNAVTYAQRRGQARRLRYGHYVRIGAA